MVPNSSTVTVHNTEVAHDDSGFMLISQPVSGIIGAGCVKQPVDVATCVQDATAAALKAIQSTCRR